MIAHFLLPVIFQTTAYQQPEPITIAVIAQSERLPTELLKDPIPRKTERFLLDNGIEYYMYKVDGFFIYVSKKVAAINDPDLTAWWLNSVAESKTRKFSLATREGRTLFEALGKHIQTGQFKPDPDHEFMAVVPAIEIKWNDKELKPLVQALDLDEVNLNSATISAVDSEDQHTISRPYVLTQPTLFPVTAGMASYSVVDFGTVQSEEKQAEAILAVSSALRMLGGKFNESKNEAERARSVLLRQLFADIYRSEAITLSGEARFNDLPLPVREKIRRSISRKPDLVGLRDHLEVFALLKDNPGFIYESRLGFLVKSAPNGGGESTTETVFIAGT